MLQRTLLAGALVLLAGSSFAAEDPWGSAATDQDLGASAARERAEGRVALAERLAEDAFEAYQQQDYQRAVELYQRAWAAAPSADIAFNIARVYDRGLHDARAAIDYYQLCVADPKTPEHRRRSAESRSAELQAELSGAEAAAAEATAVAAVASPPEVAPAPAAVPDVPANRWTAREVTAVVLGGAGVSALGLGLGFALSASSERSAWERGCDGNACSSQSAVDAARSAGRKADVATVALLAGGGLLGIGATLWFLGPDAREDAPRTALRLTPSEKAAGLAWSLSGSF